jgi:AraC family ethanolamine operon transcriptional activator
MHFAQKQVGLRRGSSPCERGSIRGADICGYMESVGDSWDASFVQLTAGHLDAGVEYLADDDFVLYRETWCQRLHLVGTLLPGMIALGLPAGAGQETRWWGQTFSATCIPIARSSSELNLVTGANEAITVLIIRETEFLKIFERLTGLLPDDFPAKGQFLTAEPRAARQVLQFWNSVLARTLVWETCNLSLTDLLMPLFDALELPILPRRIDSKKSRLLDQLMHTAEASNFLASVPQISLELGVSRRTIEYLFHDLLGTSPRVYFMMRRLNLCRHALMTAHPGKATVASIATRFGFYELGRFASAYRHFFGELPSETLRRTRGLVTVGMPPLV